MEGGMSPSMGSLSRGRSPSRVVSVWRGGGLCQGRGPLSRESLSSEGVSVQ